MAQVVSAKDFVEKENENFTLTPVRKSAQGKPEMVPLLNGKPTLIQFGTTEDPITTRGGIVRWDASAKKFFSVDSSNPAWALADRSGYFNKMTKKLHSELRLSGYEKEGTSDYYAYECMKIIIDKIVQLVVSGVPDGLGGISKVFKDEEMTEPIVRRMLTTPLQDKQPVQGKEGEFYPPALKLKVRYYVQTATGETAMATQDYTADELSNFTLNIEPRVFDGLEKSSSKVSNPFDFLKGGAPCVWIAQLNPVFFKGKSEINLTMDVKSVKCFPRKDYAANIDFVDEPLGGFEPVTKRAKTENETPTTEKEEPLYIA